MAIRKSVSVYVREFSGVCAYANEKFPFSMHICSYMQRFSDVEFLRTYAKKISASISCLRIYANENPVENPKTVTVNMLFTDFNCA